MKISIVTISYNQSQFIESAILSIINQKYENLEYIIVDPGSTDGSREIINNYLQHFSKTHLNKDKGAADGLNIGFSYASGEIFGFLNSDDELLPNSLSCIADFFKSHPHIDVVTGCGYLTDGKGSRLRRIVPSKLTTWLYVHGAVSVFQQGTFFRASYFHKVGGFNIQNTTCWDGELFLDMAIAGAKFKTIGNDLANFRLHEGGITGSGRLIEQYKNDVTRLFTKATGRPRSSIDKFQDILARVCKGILDPYYFFRRAKSLIIFAK